LAIQTRKALGNENEPFASVREAMWRLGIATFLVEFASESIDGCMWRPRGSAPCAAINVLARQGLVTAWRMSFAHELCHALFDRPKQGRTGLIEMRTEGGDAKERRANAFAAYFIAPRSAVNRFLTEYGLRSTEKPTEQHLLALSLHFGIGVEAMAWHLVNCDRWVQDDVLRHRNLVSPPFVSADDRELRASAIEQEVPIERRGLVLDLATQALAQGKISVARWRELIGLPLMGKWRLILNQRSVEVPPEG
jgi:Zn-dependent peptidase ImmA (M78 family)